MLPPIAASTGRARSSSSAGPPTRNDSAPLSACTLLPVTGASRNPTPRACAAAASSRIHSTVSVLDSMAMAPARIARERAPLAQPHAARSVVVGQHREHDRSAAAAASAVSCRDTRARGRQRRRSSRRRDSTRVTSNPFASELARHAGTHDPEPEHRNLHAPLLTSRGRGIYDEKKKTGTGRETSPGRGSAPRGG